MLASRRPATAWVKSDEDSRACCVCAKTLLSGKEVTFGQGRGFDLCDSSCKMDNIGKCRVLCILCSWVELEVCMISGCGCGVRGRWIEFVEPHAKLAVNVWMCAYETGPRRHVHSWWRTQWDNSTWRSRSIGGSLSIMRCRDQHGRQLRCVTVVSVAGSFLQFLFFLCILFLTTRPDCVDVQSLASNQNRHVGN